MEDLVHFENETFRMRKQKVSFMTGNIDVDGLVYGVIENNYSFKEIMESGIDFDNAIYSNGFISAITDGLVPVLELKPTIYSAGALQDEYHHICINDECFKMYFK